MSRWRPRKQIRRVVRRDSLRASVGAIAPAVCTKRGSCRSADPSSAERAGFLSKRWRPVNAKGGKPPSGASVALLTFRHQFVHRLDERLNGIHAIVERGLFLRVKLQLDDLFNPAGAKNDRYAHVISADAVLLVAVRRTRDQPLLVANDRFDHLRRGRSRSVIGAARLQQ